MKMIIVFMCDYEISRHGRKTNIYARVAFSVPKSTNFTFASLQKHRIREMSCAKYKKKEFIYSDWEREKEKNWKKNRLGWLVGVVIQIGWTGAHNAFELYFSRTQQRQLYAMGPLREHPLFEREKEQIEKRDADSEHVDFSLVRLLTYHPHTTHTEFLLFSSSSSAQMPYT